MYRLPTTVGIDGNEHPICEKGDYNMVLDCFAALNDAELSESERLTAAMVIFYEDITDPNEISRIFYGDEGIAAAVKKMFEFFNCGRPQAGAELPYKLIDWEKDGQMICAAVNNVAGKEIRAEPYIHWWTFIGWFNSIGESVLSTVCAIRKKISTGKKLEKFEREFKRDNPEYFIWDSRTAEQQAEERAIIDLWNANSNQ